MIIVKFYVLVESDLSRGQSPLKAAITIGQIDVSLYLINQCGVGEDNEVKQAFCRSCELGRLDAVKELIHIHNVKPTGMDHNYCTY